MLATGSIFAYRAPRDGKDGLPGADGAPGAKGDTGLTGLSIRNTEWVAGVYYRNDTSLTGTERYLDFAIIVGSGDFQDGVGTNYSIYQAKPAHNGVISAADNKPGSGASWGTYWEKINVLKPVFTPIILASLIKASQIDVDSLIVKKVITAANGTRMELVPDGDSARFVMYNQNNTPIASFMYVQDGSNYLPRLLVRDYSGTTLLRETSIRGGYINLYDAVNNRTLMISTTGIRTYTGSTLTNTWP